MMRLRGQLAVVITVAAVFQVVVPWLPAGLGRSVSDVLVTLFAGTAAVVYLRRVRQESGRARHAVQVGVASSGLWAFANLLFLVNEVFGLPVLTTVGNYGSIVAAALLPIGMHLNAPPTRGAELFRGLIDVAAVAGAVFALTWLYVISSASASSGMTGGFATALTVPEVLAAALALVTMSRNLSADGGRAPRLLGAAAVVLALAALIALRNGADERPWYSFGAGAGYVLAAGLIGVASRFKMPPDEPAGMQRHFAGAWAILPYVPITLTVAATGVEQVRVGELSPVLIWVLLSTFSLVLLRQFLTVRIVGSLAVKLSGQQEQLHHQAHHDALTSLPNRAAFHERGAEMIARHGRAAVLMLDLDGFKPVNDRLGHAAGDDVLVTVAQRLNSVVRGGDLVARLGGDEFALVLGTPEDDARCSEVADRILHSLAEPMEVQGEQVTVGGSIGITTGAGNLGELLRQADIAMYAAKAAGKGTIERYREPAAV
ncbi:hypothetical protein Ate02nite_05650 [Paractinoplanes tereljensis]|uniref:GGDEF domain-containing protein n=1 Tax=Paractinoplanes tereljensis TaxID=571912 RepID=A0A919NGQ0_9ACTN|nr:GGDEF domain-containing protein [Actinoplanes tereljensis]GIF17835.1 hypothetical protein Ate02nite_05650 [Actinoplanes tereljensis]